MNQLPGILRQRTPYSPGTGELVRVDDLLSRLEHVEGDGLANFDSGGFSVRMAYPPPRVLAIITEQNPSSPLNRYSWVEAYEESPDTVRQSDMLVIVISGKSVTDVNNQALVIDLLPAGFEVENARLADARNTDQLSWLPELTPTLYSEFLDDRFVAAIDLGWDRRSFTVAYMVRAVTPGTYSLPAVQVEDMYQPQYRARSAAATTTILPFH